MPETVNHLNRNALLRQMHDKPYDLDVLRALTDAVRAVLKSPGCKTTAVCSAPLSARQMVCAGNTIRELLGGSIQFAWWELYDVIDDYHCAREHLSVAEMQMVVLLADAMLTAGKLF